MSLYVPALRHQTRSTTRGSNDRRRSAASSGKDVLHRVRKASKPSKSSSSGEPRKQKKQKKQSKKPHCPSTDATDSTGSEFRCQGTEAHGGTISPAPSAEFFQNLPYFPEVALQFDVPDFGEQVCRQYEKQCRFRDLDQNWRVKKYGLEIAQNYSPGYTPDEARDKYEEKQQKGMRQFEQDLLDGSDDDRAPEDREAITPRLGLDERWSKPLHTPPSCLLKLEDGRDCHYCDVHD